MPRFLRRSRAYSTHAYRRDAYYTLHAMDCVAGLIAARVTRERRDHADGVGRVGVRVGSVEYPRRTA